MYGMNVNKTLKAEKEDEPSFDQQQQEFQIVSIVKLGKQSKAKKNGHNYTILSTIAKNSIVFFSDIIKLQTSINQ